MRSQDPRDKNPGKVSRPGGDVRLPSEVARAAKPHGLANPSREVPLERPRKVRVGPFRVSVEKTVADSSRDNLVSRARRHFRNVEMGPRVKIDPDESVRRGPRRPERGPSLLGRRPLGSGLLGSRGDYDDDLD